MAPRFRILNLTLAVALVVVIGSTLGVLLLRSPVVACTVGFHATTEPLSSGQVGQCTTDEIASALLLAIGLVAGGVLIWMILKSLTDRSSSSVDRRERNTGGPSDTSDSEEARGAGQPGGFGYLWVCLLVAAFFAVSFSAASWQYLQLYSGNLYSTDLATNQQVLSSVLLGSKPYAFYEAYNCGEHGQCSYLQVHQAFFGYAIALAYGVGPSPFALFAIQSLALALTALPLYFLAVDVSGSSRLSLVVVGTYITWLPFLIIATKDTYNWEAFIPVELLTLFWLWNRRRYLFAIPVVFLAFLTYEVNTVLVFFVGAYFVWPWLVRGARLLSKVIIGKSDGTSNKLSRLGLWFRWVRTALRVPEVYASLVLMTCSLAAYVLLRLFVLDGGWLLGLPPVPHTFALPVNSPNRVFVFTLGALEYAWEAKLLFWVVVFLTLGFIPLLAPRALILLLPWLALADFNLTPSFWSFAGHYILPPTAALFVGFTFGLTRLRDWISQRSLHQATVTDSTTTPIAASPASAGTGWYLPGGGWSSSRSSRSSASGATSMLTVGVLVLIAGNLFLSPLNPLATPIVSQIGPPFPSPYGISYTSPPGEQALERLASVIPENAIVTAPPSVYTLVADDPYAYPMQGPRYNLNYLPGHESDRVSYVLLPYDTPNGDFNSTLLSVLYDRSDFGVRGCVSQSPVGGVELFQRNYTGAPEVFGPPGPLCPNYFSGGTGLTLGLNAEILNNTSSPSGAVLQSTPCAATESYLAWSGPDLELPSGEYGLDVVFNVLNSTTAQCQKTSFGPGRTLFQINVLGQDASGVVKIAHHPIPAGSACQSSNPTCRWNYWNTTFTLSSATTDLNVSGMVLIGQYQYALGVAYVALWPGQP